MNSRNIIILLISLFLVIISTNVLVHFNDKKANYTLPTFVGETESHNQLIFEADTAYSNKNYDEALSLYNQVLSHYPENFPLLDRIASIYIKKQNFVKAEGIYRNLIKKAPDNSQYSALLALTLLEQFNHSEAAHFATKAIELKNPTGLPLLVLAATHAARKNTESCLKALDATAPNKAVLEFLETVHFEPIREDPNFIEYYNKLKAQLEQNR